MKRITIFLAVALALVGCGETNENQGSETITAPSQGQLVYESHCITCHSNGINGAPIPGKSKMWAPRLVQGVPVLVEHAINGFGLMPPKGGKKSMSDADVEAAVIYMVNKSKV